MCESLITDIASVPEGYTKLWLFHQNGVATICPLDIVQCIITEENAKNFESLCFPVVLWAAFPWKDRRLKSPLTLVSCTTEDCVNWVFPVDGVIEIIAIAEPLYLPCLSNSWQMLSFVYERHYLIVWNMFLRLFVIWCLFSEIAGVLVAGNGLVSASVMLKVKRLSWMQLREGSKFRN